MSDTWRDESISPAERAKALLDAMTLDEKLAQLGCVWSTALVDDDAFCADKARSLLSQGVGEITRIGGGSGLRPAEVASFTNEIQRFLRDETRLGIPALVHEESCAGFLARDATQFPQAIGMASTWDPALVERVGQVIREQMVAVGARHTLAPVLDVARDPRWGRVEETLGEDPYLIARLGVAYVRGVQGEDLREGVAATGKHFLGYGFSEGGLNHAPAHIGARELREVFAAPFAAAIAEAGLATVMNAYNEVDGLPCAGSRAILDDLLRGELGFEGLVVADYFSVALLERFHRVAGSLAEAARRALEAGLDMELPQADGYGAPLREGLRNGDVDEAWVDRSTLRVLRLKFDLGLFETVLVDAERAPEVFDTPQQRALARAAGRRSIVLLRNDGDLLPLSPDTARLAVIGPAAHDVRLLQGDYHYPAHLEMMYAAGGSTQGIAPHPDDGGFRAGPYYPETVTPLDGIRAAVSDGCEVRHAAGCEISGDERRGLDEARDLAGWADVAIVCVGGRSGLSADCTTGEFRDASDLGLTGLQQELVEVIVATGTPTVVVLVSGRVHAIPWIAEHVPAVLEAWVPGEEGGAAIADLLFGVEAPSGRLPVSLPRSVGQVPAYYNHKSGGGRSMMLGDYIDGSPKPLFPFGHGLSYTEFAYTDLEIEPASVPADGEVRIALQVGNTGDRAAEEVVQLYLRDPVASLTRPVKQLAGFARVALEPGATRRVTFTLDPGQLAFYDEAMELAVEPGEVEVHVGASSEDLRLEGAFAITSGRRLSLGEARATRAELG